VNPKADAFRRISDTLCLSNSYANALTFWGGISLLKRIEYVMPLTKVSVIRKEFGQGVVIKGDTHEDQHYHRPSLHGG
jgi:hypothetical protein